MAIREYRCNGCHRTVEILMRMSDDDLLTFEGCQSGSECEIERLYSVAALRTNGIDKSEDLFHEGKQNQYRGEKTITRDFMQVGPDGKATFTAMKPGEYDPKGVGENA